MEGDIKLLPWILQAVSDCLDERLLPRPTVEECTAPFTSRQPTQYDSLPRREYRVSALLDLRQRYRTDLLDVDPNLPIVRHRKECRGPRVGDIELDLTAQPRPSNSRLAILAVAEHNLERLNSQVQTQYSSQQSSGSNEALAIPFEVEALCSYLLVSRKALAQYHQLIHRRIQVGKPDVYPR